MKTIPTPEQEVAYRMAEKIQAWVDELPKWRQMQEVNRSKANFNKTVAATQIAKAVSRLMKSTSDVLNANIDCVLGHQARTAYELYFDTAWLRMNDGNGNLSEQFMTWQAATMFEINGTPCYGTDLMRKARERFGDKLDESPDEWTAVEGERRVTNSNNRREAVAIKLEERGLGGMRGGTRSMFKMLNALSHGMTSTAQGGKPVLTDNILTGCYLTIQECQDWLLEITDQTFPDEETEAVAKSLWEYATECLVGN